MSAPYIPFYIDDFDGATAHLSAAEEGIYMRLIKMAWRTPRCELPNDIPLIARRCRASVDEVEPILREFFKLSRGRWRFPLSEQWTIRWRKSQKRPPLEVAVRLAVLERDGYQCQYCSTFNGPFEIDHIHPVALGGSDDLDNLACACLPCNRSKGAKLVSEWRCEV